MNDEGLVLTHANEHNDENYTKNEIIKVLEVFDGTIYEVPEKYFDGTAYGMPDKYIPSYGSENLYDEVLKERGHGKLEEEDTVDLVRRYENGKIFLGGGFARGCLRKTYDSLKNAVAKTVWEVEVKVVPEITYDRCFNFSNLRDEFGFNEKFTLDEVKDWNPDNLPEDISIYFENGDIESIL